MRRFITIAVMVFIFCSAVNADTMTWNDDNGNYGFGYYDMVKIFSVTSPYSSYTIRAGELDVTYGGRDYMGYCVDLMQSLGDYSVTELAPTSESLLKASYLFETQSNNVSSGTDAAALQVALWEIVHEDYSGYGYDVTDSSSNFYITNNTDVSSAANSLLGELVVPLDYNPSTYIKVLASDTGQDVIIKNADVPEPSTIMLLGIGGLFFFRKQKA